MASRKFQTVPPYTGRNDAAVLRGLTDVVSYITAQAQEVVQPVTPVPASAFDVTLTTAQIAALTATQVATETNVLAMQVNALTAKVNELIARLQGTQ